MIYLTASELADLTGYKGNQYGCMRRWLERNKWPFEQDRNGLPKVLRAYHDRRMHGNGPRPELPPAANAESYSGPKFDALKGAMNHGRKTKAA